MPHATTRRDFLATTAAVPGALALPAIGAPTYKRRSESRPRKRRRKRLPADSLLPSV